MRGLKANDLAAILDFIYHGEANILQEDLNRFLSLAEELQLKGLADSPKESMDSELKTQNNDVIIKTEQIHTKQIRQKPKQIMTQSEINLLKEEVVSKEDPIDRKSHKQKQLKLGDSIKSKDRKPLMQPQESSFNLVLSDARKMLEDTKRKIAVMMEKVTDNKGEIKWKCAVCEKYFKQERDLKRHIEIHIEGVSFPCKHCGVVKGSTNALNTLISRHHKVKMP
jgi:hypothetical protein